MRQRFIKNILSLNASKRARINLKSKENFAESFKQIHQPLLAIKNTLSFFFFLRMRARVFVGRGQSKDKVSRSSKWIERSLWNKRCQITKLNYLQFNECILLAMPRIEHQSARIRNNSILPFLHLNYNTEKYFNKHWSNYHLMYESNLF